MESSYAHTRFLTSFCLLGTLAVCGCQPDAATIGPRSLVTVEWLSQNAGDLTVVPIHIGSEDTFTKEHIPGARYLPYGDFMVRTDSATGLRNELPAPDTMRDRLEGLGVSDDSKIVVYADNERTLFATRLLFTLDYLGLGDRSFLLDGGLLAWKATGHPVTDEQPEVARGTLTARPVHNSVVNADWIAQRLGTPGYVLIDARPYEQYAGAVEQSDAEQGHIPGAVSLPLTELFDGSGRIRQAAELERLFQNTGFTPGDTVIAYCVTGVLATGVTYAAGYLGYETVLYDGSMEDWTANPERPLEVVPAGR